MPRASHRRGILLADRSRREERPQGARLYSSAMRSSFIVPLQSSHSLIRYGGSVLSGACADRESRSARVTRFKLALSMRVCVVVVVVRV